MNRRGLTSLLLFALLIAVVIGSFVIGGTKGGDEEAFAGTDATVSEQIEADGYTPWFSPLVELKSAEVESGLFALQAALGGAAFGYCVGILHGRRRRTGDVPEQAGAADAGPAPAQAKRA